MVIAGIQKLTLLDYPGKTSLLVFTQGCNFRCPFCHNKDLIKRNSVSNIDKNEIISYLKKRKKLLDGVCITGGEPLIHSDIMDFIKEIKNLGYLVKIDTNGSNPEMLKKLVDENMIDYIAMDIKTDFSNYDKLSGVNYVNTENIKQSIKLIKSSGVDHEFRTTIVKQYHNINNLQKICEYIGIDSKYYIQNYRDSANVVKKGLSGFDDAELNNIKIKLNEKYPNVFIR